jgi:hypothetical protein
MRLTIFVHYLGINNFVLLLSICYGSIKLARKMLVENSVNPPKIYMGPENVPGAFSIGIIQRINLL